MYDTFNSNAIDINIFSILVYESYARSPVDELNMTPKEPGDFRERVERETIRG
jgi:hypothetical protein